MVCKNNSIDDKKIKKRQALFYQGLKTAKKTIQIANRKGASFNKINKFLETVGSSPLSNPLDILDKYP